MKRILTLMLLLSSQLVFGQSFEGTVTYASDFEVEGSMKKMGVTKEMIAAKMKEDGSYFDTIQVSYKQDDYYTSVNSNPRSWTIYRADANKIYAMQDGDASDICTVTDASIDLEFATTGRMPMIEKLDTTVLINGATCHVVSVTWKSGTYYYYYHPGNLKINPALFSKHAYDGWSDFVKISNSLPVKIVKTVKGMMTITMTLTSSRSEHIDARIFAIPELVPDKDLNIIKLANREVMRIKK